MYTVLIADDSAVVRRVVRSLFEEENDWTILEATDGREAVEQAQRLRPDLVVLDYSMPLMNGLEAAVVIKRAQPRLPSHLIYPAQKQDPGEAGFREGLQRRLFQG